MKKVKFIGLFLLLLFSGVLYGCLGASDFRAPNAYITIDINPSIEIITGDNGLVVEVNALNNDAEILLVETDFTGKSVEEVTEFILQLATELGYIDIEADNAIIITAETDDVDATAELEDKLSEKIQKFITEREIKLTLIQAKLAASEEIKLQAEELGISVGKLKLITFAMAFDSELTLEEAAGMSVRNLNAIVRESRKEVRNFYTYEIKDYYHEVKEELMINYYKEKISLINNAIQNSGDEVFEEFLQEGVVVSDIKALYQEYYDEIEAYQPNEDTDEITDIDLSELYKQKEDLIENLKLLLKESAESKSSQEWKTLREQIRNIKGQIQNISDQLGELGGSFMGGFKMGHFCFKYNGKTFEYKARNMNLRQLRAITAKYRGLFQKIGIDLEELELTFMVSLANELAVLEESYQVQLEAKREKISEQKDVLKDYLKREKETLKEICMNNRKHRK